MIRYVISRLLQLIPVILCVSFLVYALLDLAPGTVIDHMVTDAMTQEEIDELRAMYNLDRPMIYRYARYMLNLLQGDLGVSDISRLPVWDTFISRLPATLLLSVTSIIFGASISIPMGIRAARRAGTITDNMTTLITLIGISMPGFWLGLLLLQVFSLWLGWFPAGGMGGGLRSLILPAVCSGLLLMASAARQTRSSMLEVLNADYLRTARAKGVPEKVVVRKHALGNASIPIIATLGGSMSMSISGSVIVETVFAWPGVGRLAVEAVQQRDVTMALGCVILTTILFVLMQIIIDLCYAFADPRIKARYVSLAKRKKKSRVSNSGSQPSTSSPQVAVAVVGDGEIAQTEEETTNNSSNQYASVNAAASEHMSSSNVKADSAETQKNAVPDVSSKEPQKSFVTRHFSNGAEKEEQDVKDVASGESAVRRYRKHSRMGEIFHGIKKNKGATAGMIILGLLVLTFFAGLFISREAITEGIVVNRFSPPNLRYPFGTDNMGRNLFLRVIYGTRYSLSIGVLGSIIATVIGVMLGAISGFYGGKIDDLIMRFADILSSIPGMLFGMVLMIVLGGSVESLIIVIGISAMPVFLRITRASMLSARNNEYIEAAKAIGLSNFRTIFTQALPNGLSPIIVTFTLNLGIVIIIAASLSFMGFGVPIPTPEWGALVAAGRDSMRTAWWLTTFPGLFIMLTVLAFNLLGDGLRDVLDPKFKR